MLVTLMNYISIALTVYLIMKSLYVCYCRFYESIANDSTFRTSDERA